jgi:putative heme-binding domain-containing protein
MPNMCRYLHRIALSTLFVLCTCAPLTAQTLEQQLQQTSVAQLVKLAREQGDAARGAIVFFQPHMACSKCHAVGDGKTTSLGPDLATLADVNDEGLVESVLWPSKLIRKGYESVVVVTTDGRKLSGVVVERTSDRLTIRDVERSGESSTLSSEDIEQVESSAVSIMPAGQVNQLASRQQFLDLLRYLMEIAELGQARAKELQPPPAAYAARALPASLRRMVPR